MMLKCEKGTEGPWKSNHSTSHTARLLWDLVWGEEHFYERSLSLERSLLCRP